MTQAAPLTLAIADLPAFATALVAESEGYYAAEGLDLTIIHCVNGRRCLKHLTDGDAQFATVADTPIVMASLAGAQFEIVATIATTSRENRFIARADRGIRSAADLKGKRIGVVKGTSGHYFADAFLLFNGLDPAQVTFVALDGADAAGPLVRGEVDAAGLYQPHGYKARAQLGANAIVLPDPKIFTVTIDLVSVPASRGASDEQVTRLLRAMLRANRFIAEQPARARAAVARRLKLESAVLDAIWSDFDYDMSLTQSLITTLEAEARWALRQGFVSGARAMPDYLDFIRTGPLIAVDRRAVSLVK